MRDIEYFSMVAEHGNVGRAAEALGLSQPALSKSLRRLEAFMQARLVRRTSKGVELTEVGSALFSQVRRLRLSLDDVMREVTDLRHGRAGHLRIGAGPGFAIHLVPLACAALLKDAPGVTFKVTVLERDALMPALRHGELDLAVVTIPASRQPDLVEEHLYEEEFVVYTSTSHRLSGKTRVTMSDLAQERWAVPAANSAISQRLNQAFLDAGLPPPRFAMETASVPLRQQLLASSDLLGFGSKLVLLSAAPRLRFKILRVTELAHTRRAGLVYRKSAYLSPTALRFVEILKTTAKEIAPAKP